MEEQAGKNSYAGLGHFITTGTYPIEKDFASDILTDNNVYFIVLYRNLTNSIDYLQSLGWTEITGNQSFIVLCQDQFFDDKKE